MYTGLVTIFLWHTLYFMFIYMMMMYVFFHLSLHVLLLLFFFFFFFSSLCTCFFMYAIFISFSHMMPWWVLFKCFKKKGCESLSCHELSSCKNFQEFVVGIDFFCNTTSGYEFNNLRLLSWLFVCYDFVTNCQRGRLLGTYFM